MPLTRAQANDKNILNSFVQFMDRTIKADYDPIALSTALNSASDNFPSPLKLLTSSPDNLSTIRQVPCIAVKMTPVSNKDNEYEIGSSAVTRHSAFTLSCYPSLDANDEPCDIAHLTLTGLVRDAFDGVCMSIIDYTDVSCGPENLVFCQDVMQITGRTAPIDRTQTTALAEEKHRFDMHVQVSYPVMADLRT